MRQERRSSRRSNRIRMKIASGIKHILFIVTGAFLILGLPFLGSNYFRTTIGGVDAVSGATVIVEKPSGEYVILINRDFHNNAENLEQWILFFSGGEISYIFEDLSCSVALGDAGGAEMARSFQSRLPENQMKIQTEEATMLFSRADHGKFDVIVLSKEFADQYHVETAFGDGVEVIRLQ